jgi:putative aldouronate transport system substrate-binding protein
MDDYVDSMKEAIDLMGEDFMKSSYVNGSLYSLPVYKANTFQWYFMCRKDLADEAGVDLNSINSVADLEDLLTKVHENHPEIYPLCPTNPNSFMLINSADGPEADVDIDYLGDNPESCTGAVIGNSGKVENFYASDAFKKMVERAYDWNQKGLLMPEASVSPDIASDLIAAGRGFGSVIGYGYPMSEAMANSGTYGDYEMTWATCGTDLMQSSAFSNQFSLGYTSADPAAACRLMNLLWTDEYVINTIIYGLEGEDYVIPDGFDPANAMPDYPEGVTAETAPYQARVSCGCFGNNFLMYGFMGDVKDFGMDLINNSKKSDYLGFLFDGSNVKTEITAVNNVISQYYTGLECGEMNPDETLPKFISELEAAGIDTIIAEKQSQLDSWLAQQ